MDENTPEDTPEDMPEDMIESPEEPEESVNDFEEPAYTAPPPQPAPAEDRLVRDPSATFGGVLSGIAHRYGWDVALTRLAFVVLFLLSGGSALLAYLFAWLIIPRATMWPPVVVTGVRGLRRPGGISSRDVGIGLLGLAAIVTLAVSAGDAAAVIVPVALIGAGVWLLSQNPRVATATEAPMAPPAGAMPTTPVYGTTLVDAPQTPPPPLNQQPVPPRSRTRRVAKIGLIGFGGLFALGLVAIPLIVIATITNGDFDISSDDRVIYQPNEILPADIDEDAGELIVDLRGFDFEALDEARDLKVQLDAGRLEVILPEGLAVDIDSNVAVGEMTILGQGAEGIANGVTVNESDEKLRLDLDVNLGQIEVFRDNDRVIDGFNDAQTTVRIEVDG